ncbi:MAG: DUF11 domain-containing protein, partial [Planctomycetes bacterium]|nr:DUF11 domain-containing protein [Planctomycetota bacterium]
MKRTLPLLMVLAVAVALAASAAAQPAGSSGAVVTWVAPAEVLVGREFSYKLIVTNVTGQPLADVEVVSQSPEGFTLKGTEPAATVSGDTLVWKIARMEAGQSQTMTVTGSAAGTGAIKPCAHATCRLPQACTTIRAVQPKLELAKSGPAEVLICEPITYTVVVRNTGDGVATEVRVDDALPEGLTTEDGRNTVAFNAGDLKPGEAKQASYRVKASRRGTFDNTAKATSAEGAQAQATHQVVVREPLLRLTKTGPEMRYLGREVAYTITVENTGDGPARSLVLTDTLPDGLTLISAGEGGQAGGGRVVWNLGTLEPGGSKAVSLTCRGDRIATVKNVAAATATCTDAAAEVTTRIEGIPAILFEVVDLEDPIEVGKEETYKIEVTNQGSAVGTNISVSCTLPPEQDYVSGKGPTQAAVQGKAVTFAPLASLAPKATAVYYVTVKAVKAGDVRFAVEL